MAEREIIINSYDPATGRAVINDPGNPFGGGSTAMVPAGQTAALFPVRLPSGAMINVGSQAEAQLLDAEYRRVMAQQQGGGVFQIGGGGRGGTLGTFAEAGLAISEWFNGREAKRLVERAIDARADARVAEKAVIEALRANDPATAASAFEDYAAANRRVNDYQDDIAMGAATQAYWRAGGGALKTVERISGGGGMGSVFGGDAGPFLMGAAGGFLLSDVLDDRSRRDIDRDRR